MWTTMDVGPALETLANIAVTEEEGEWGKFDRARYRTRLSVDLD